MDDQRVCCLCNQPISGLGNKHLSDDAWVCKECVGRMKALAPGQELDYADATQESVREYAQKLTAISQGLAQLKSVMDARAAQFTANRSFDVPDGRLVDVDDTHQLVRMPVLGESAFNVVTLAISELVRAQATTSGLVRVTTNLAVLPGFYFQVPIPDSGIGAGGGFLLGGVVGYMVASHREDDCDQQVWQMASGAAEYINALVAAPIAAPSPADELIKWKSLLDSGGITQDEYDAKKKQLLGL